jgi:hypothetical protein
VESELQDAYIKALNQADLRAFTILLFLLLCPYVTSFAKEIRIVNMFPKTLRHVLKLSRETQMWSGALRSNLIF